MADGCTQMGIMGGGSDRRINGGVLFINGRYKKVGGY